MLINSINQIIPLFVVIALIAVEWKVLFVFHVNQTKRHVYSRHLSAINL